MKETTRGLVNFDWTFSTEATYWSHEQIQSAATLETAKAARRAAEALESINRKLDSLGLDGLHEVIRAQARRDREQRKQLLARRRRARVAAKRKAARP